MALLFASTTGTNAHNAVVSVVAIVGVNSTQKRPSQCRITRRLSRTLIVMRNDQVEQNQLFERLWTTPTAISTIVGEPGSSTRKPTQEGSRGLASSPIATF